MTHNTTHRGPSSLWPEAGKSLRVLAATLLAAALIAAPLLAASQTDASHDADALRVRSLAANCAGCHGTDGHAAAGSATRAIAGVQAAYLAEQMRAFKTDVRPGTVMPQLAKGYNEAQIDALAAYFAQVAPAAKR
jgi:cytochrome subunit of sulfide dehydrogenase